MGRFEFEQRLQWIYVVCHSNDTFRPMFAEFQMRDNITALEVGKGYPQ